VSIEWSVIDQIITSADSSQFLCNISVMVQQY
jgi:hypothetical protein